MVAEIVGAKLGVILPTDNKEIPNLSKAGSVLFICLIELNNNKSPMGRKEIGHPMYSFDIWNPESVKIPGQSFDWNTFGLLNCFICTCNKE